ncbi:MAG TPA: ABC transporter permease subunit [Fimbriimonadaceae bacterium]|nr:ABC transporter permease subunit [Fimbriimonadaceae bacterium]
MKKRRLDWLFWMGAAYLVLLLVFAIVGPVIGHDTIKAAVRDVCDVAVQTELHAGQFVVQSVRSDAPAAQYIQADDVIVSVDGRQINTDTVLSMDRALEGPQGSDVTLQVMKGDGTVHDVSLKRDQTVAAAPFMPPSREFWLGTDEQGRDVFARLAFGARMSLFIGFLVQSISLVVGVIMGTLGVFAPKWISIPVLRLTDGMFAFPDILLAILIVGIWADARFTAMIVALSITAWPAVARLARTLMASLKDREYVIASKALGANTGYLVVKHILPHLIGVLLAVAMIDVAAVILAESALSFLGIGIAPPTPSWGNMINTARLNMSSHPVALLWPCLILSLTIFALNFVGDGLRALADPKSG